MCFTLLFFFLYDVIWAIADFENFSLYLNGHYLYILADLVYCGLFSLLSLSANHVLLLTSSLRHMFCSCTVSLILQELSVKDF